MGKFYHIYVVLVYQLLLTVSLPVTIQPNQFHLPPWDVSQSKMVPPQNVLMSVSIEPSTGPSAIPCLATIRVSNVPALEAVTSPNNTVSAPFTESINSASGAVSSILVSFSDSKPDVSALYQLSPKESRKSITRPSFSFIDNSPTITKSLNLLPFTEGHKGKGINQDNLYPKVKSQQNLQSPIKNSIHNADVSSKFTNSQSPPHKNNRVSNSFLNQASPLNKQIFQQPKLTYLNNYINSTATHKEPVKTTLEKIPLATALDKNQLAVQSPNDIFPTSILTAQEPLSITTNYNLIKYPLKARSSSTILSTPKEISPSANNNPSSSLLRNLTLSLPPQSKKHLPSDVIPPIVSQNPSLSRPQRLDISTISQPIKSNSKSSQKLIEILKSSYYKNYKSPESTNLNNYAVPTYIKPPNLINTPDKTLSTSSNLMTNDRLLSSSMTIQDQPNKFKSISLVSEVPNIGTNSLSSTAIEKNSLSSGHKENLIRQSNQTINLSDSKESLNSLVSCTLSTAPTFNINKKNYNNVHHHLEMSNRLGAENTNQQTNLNKETTYPERSSYNSDGMANTVPNYFDLECSIPSSLPTITLPNIDALSNARFNPVNENLSNPTVLQTFNSVKESKGGDLVSNLEPVVTLKSREFPIIRKITLEMSHSPPVTSLEPFNLTSPLIKSPSFLPKPNVTNLSTVFSSTSTSTLLNKELSSTSADVPNSISSSKPCITSITINIIPYTQETTSEIIIII